MTKKPLPPIDMEEIKEILRNDPGRGASSLVPTTNYRRPKTKRSRQELAEFFDEWEDDHDESGRVIPKRYD